MFIPAEISGFDFIIYRWSY